MDSGKMDDDRKLSFEERKELKTLVDQFVKAGGKIIVCPPHKTSPNMRTLTERRKEKAQARTAARKLKMGKGGRPRKIKSDTAGE
jgi:hypothetical protein